METITFTDLLAKVGVSCKDSRIVRGISDDSREVEQDMLFVAIKATAMKKEHILEALTKGAVVLCEKQPFADANIYEAASLKQKLILLLDTLYGRYEACQCIAVSGTNGKTSVASYIAQLLYMQKARVMVIGTGFVKGETIFFETSNTTPGLIALAKYFDIARRKQITHIVMEVSSHAIALERIARIRFDAVVFTNITADHLDYHITKTHYRFTKFKLANYLKKSGVIIYNADYEYMLPLVHMQSHRCVSYGLGAAHIPIEHVVLSESNIRFSLQGYKIRAHLLGLMNVYNVAAALTFMRINDVEYERLQEDVEKLRAVKGRLEVVYQGKFQVWIDYAHTAAALKEVLSFAKQVAKGRVISIVGCGGNRDVKKRPIMAEIAAKYSDVAIYTSDNPRFERVCDILKDMHAERFLNACVFEHRYYAIKHAVKIAQNSDIIVIIGKGSEAFTSIYGKQYPCNDATWVKKLLDQGGETWK